VLEPTVQADALCCDTLTTSRLSDNQAQEAANLLKALADPARLQILDILSQHGGQVCACDFEGKVGQPDASGHRPKQPTISHHLKVLRDAGLIDGEKHGLWVYYFVRPDRLTAVQTVLGMLNGKQSQVTPKVANGNQQGCC